jgi:3'-5' exoribonuclease
MRMIADKLAHLPDFPPRLRTLVEHMILSHHGHLEFGSPKIPQFPEAMLLHYLDDLDSKMECMRVMVDRDQQVEGFFTGYSPSMERSILKKSKFLDQQEPAPLPAPPLVAVPEPPKPAPPPRVVVPEAPKPAPPPRPSSFFGDKLIQALVPGPGKES